jgi:TRAP-type C4-dicarboxylate transport system substrate-binding protein
MKNWRIIFSIICLVTVVTLLPFMSACTEETSSTATVTKTVTATATTETPETFNLKVVSGLPEGHAGNRDLIFWAEELEERTGGRVTTEIYEGTLGSPPEFYDMIKNGVIDVMSMGDAWAPDQFPVFAVNMLPFEYPNWQVLSATIAEMCRMGYFPGMEPFKLLYLKPTVIMYPFFKEKKVTQLEDFEGMVIRPPGGPIFSATVEALGATAKSLPGSETYMALSTGQVEGAFTGIDNVIGRKFYEVCEYGIKDAPIFGGVFFMIMNLDTWNSLPCEVQLVIEQLNLEAYDYFLRGQMEEEQGYWDQCEAEGVELYTIGTEEYARWKAACADVAEEWATGLDAEGMPGTEVLEMARAIIARYTQ